MQAKQRLVCLWFVLLLIVTSCHRRTKVSSTPAPQNSAKGCCGAGSKQAPPVAVGYVEKGIASWYGVPYHGRPAADGEIYNMETLVAAHRTMPFNTWVRVTNLNNSKSVDVRVIDRGPFVGNRIIDLSKAAARQIDLIGPGTGEVKVEVISAPADIASNDFYTVQVGAYASYENADRVRAQYATRFGSAQLSLKQGSTPLYRVLVGRVRSMPDAGQLADRLRAETGSGVFIVRLDETVPPSLPAPPVPGSGVEAPPHVPFD